MLLTNDKILDEKNTSDPYVKEYLEGVKILKGLFDKNESPTGTRVLQIIPKIKQRINKSGMSEPIPIIYIPYTANSTSANGYKVTWRYSPHSPNLNSSTPFEEQGFQFTSKMTFTENDMDKLYFLLFKSPYFAIKKEKARVGYLDSYITKEIEEVKDDTILADVKFFIYSEHSPLFGDNSKLITLAEAWGVDDVQHLKRMYLKYTNSKSNTANDFVIVLKNRLEKQILRQINNGVPFDRFVEAVTKDPKWLNVRIGIIELLDLKYIVFAKTKGQCYFDIAGEQTQICTVPAKKRHSDAFIDIIMKSIMEDVTLSDIFNGLLNNKSLEEPRNWAEFIPKAKKDITALSFDEKKELGSFLNIKFDENTKEAELNLKIYQEFVKSKAL